MSNEDVDYGAEDPSDFIVRDQRRTVAQALDPENDPEKAARSMELADATGDHPAVIYSNLENYEAQHKAALTSSLLRSNNYLRQYVDADPMHAKLSADDYGNLDTASEMIAKTVGPNRFSDWLKSDSIWKEFWEGVGDQPLGASAFRQEKDWEFSKEHPVAGAIGASLASIGELVSRPASGVLNVVSKEVGNEAAALLEYLMMKGEGPGFSAGGFNAKLLHELKEGAKLDEVPEPTHTVLTINGVDHVFEQSKIDKLGDMAQAIKPWIEDGKEPPAGLHPEIDKLKYEQNKLDIDNLDEALKAAQASATRERSPEIFANFVRQHTDASISVSGDALVRLYGDKVPEAGDGILGFVPGLAAELETARATGGDVRVPLADWLAKVDPEVAKELHDDIRVRPGAITKAEIDAKTEGKEGVEGYKPPQPLPEALPSVRGSAGLEPSFSTGDRRLKIEKREASVTAEGVIKSDEFKLIDENGKNAGWLEVVPLEGGKKLYVDNVGGFESRGYGANAFGPALTRDLARQLKEQYPDAEQIGGFRISGAREKAGTTRQVWVKFDEMADRHQALYDLFNYQAVDLSHSQLRYNPELNIDRAAADKAVREELAKMIGKNADIFTPDAIINRQSPSSQRMGFMQPNLKTNPWIVVAIETPDAVGIARHEGWHFLEDFGFFKPNELMTVQRAAREQDWVGKYNIDKRYPTLDNAGKLREAMAEGYRDWAAGRPVPEALHPIFERIRELFENLKDRLKEILGRDVTWEEVFAKADSGEVGQRQPAGHEKGAFLEPKFADERETIKGPAARFEGKIYEGITHPIAAEKALKTVGKTLDDADKVSGLEHEGFLTSTGRYVSREEAYKIAVESEQITENAKKYMRGRESLDAGDLGMAKHIKDMDIKFAEGEAPFDRAAAIGMTNDQFSNYMKLIEQRHAEDLAAATKRAEASQAKRQTAEWKTNEKEVRAEVKSDITSRPDVAADTFFSGGGYFGQAIAERPRIDPKFLSPEQKARFPKDYLKKDGLNPDDIANLFGYPSGDAMIRKLSDYHEAKVTSAMDGKEFIKQLVDAETQRRMEARYGLLEKSIIEEAKDQATSETQLNLLHEEVLALALRNGGAGRIDKAKLKDWVGDKFGQMKIGSVKSDEHLATAGRTGREAELALLKQDFADAFQAKQQQYLAVLMAKEAATYEKSRASFDKLAKRYSKREVAGASPEYTDGVHDILQRLGQPVRRSIQDVADSMKMNGYDGLRDLVSSKEAQLRDLHTPDWLQDPAFRKPLDELTTQEFEQVHNALKAITHNSRDELKVEKQGEKADLEVVIGEMIDKMKSLGEPRPHPREEGAVARQVKNYWWSGITVESMLNRLDRDDPRGPFYQYITHHFTEAANYKDKLIKQFQKQIAEIGKIEDMDKQVDNTLFRNPETGEALLLRRRNVLGILQNVGNKNNLTKLAKGYNLEPEQVLSWLHVHTTKEDWDRAQKIGGIFNEVFDMANTMSHSISGVGIQRLPLEALDTPHGSYPGWYNPIKYDPFLPGRSKKLMGTNPLEEEGFYRATTPQGYTQERTGYIAPVDLSLDIVPQRMQQMIHDIAMRPAVLQMSKFFYDNRFERAMTNFYGAHQAKEMIPFLRDIANAPNFKSMTQQLGNQAIEFFRQNTIATLIGFNPGTVAKHGATAWVNSMTEVGALNYLREFKNIVAETGTGRATWTMAMEKSEELQRRMRNFAELIQGHGSEINIRGARSGFMSLREMVTNAGASPVSFSDLLSAVPTWAAKYKEEIAAGSDEGMAVSLANRAVRQAHGSSVVSNKPAIARTNALGATFSSLYGFFSHMQQKQYALAWKARDMLSGQREVSKTVPELVGGLFSYVIAPAIIEELVTPTTNNEHESWGRKAASTLAMGVSSSFIGIRDFVRAAINVRDPQAGLIGTSIKAGTDLARDLSKGPQAFTKEKAGNLIKHTFALNGVLTGLTNEQEGKMAEYMYNYFNGKEKPKGPWDVGVGLRFGKTDKHTRSFEQWRKQTLGGR